MDISVIGTGYVGLVSGTCFADMGNSVMCVDIDKLKIKNLNKGEIPIYEPDLDELFHRNQQQGRLHFTTDLSKAAKHADIIFLALPTPPGEDGGADLSHVLKVAEDLGKLIDEYKVIVNKSTVPVGTGEKVAKVIGEYTSVDFDVVSNPEFLREGGAVEDFMKPDRVVVGTDSKKAEDMMKRLYDPFVRQGNPVLFMDVRSAELTKYASNSYLATRISFMNEIANICEKVDANVDKVRLGMGTDKRIGKRFLFPGVGFGGSCFPKDVKALIKTAQESNYQFNILNAVNEVNQYQRTLLVDKLRTYFDGNLKGRKIAIWGLSFKPETDDIREAPAQYIINELLDEGVELAAFDPEALENMKELFGNKVQFESDQYKVLDQADALLIITEWTVFRSPDFEKMKEKLKEPVIFDGRNLYGLEEMKEKKFYYNSVGRQVVTP